MAAAKYLIKMEQGSTFLRTLTMTNDDGSVFDLTGYNARMQIRPSIASSTVILSLDTTSSDGYITITPTLGAISINVPATVTSTLSTTTTVYDLEIESSDGIVTRLLEGSVRLDLNVTR